MKLAARRFQAFIGTQRFNAILHITYHDSKPNRAGLVAPKRLSSIKVGLPGELRILEQRFNLLVVLIPL